MKLRRLRTWRFNRIGSDFAVYLTGWIFVSNHAYSGERRYFVRIGSWRKTFGRVQR